jgi:hypothetical protein
MFLNAAFLVKRDQQAQFEQLAKELARRFEGWAAMRYAGPLPISNFVEIVVHWD